MNTPNSFSIIVRLVLVVATLLAASELVGQESTTDVAWLADVQKTPSGTMQSFTPDLLLVRDLKTWQDQRSQLRATWREFLGQRKRPLALPAIEIVSDEIVGAVRRQLIRYGSEPGWPTEAYLLMPVETGPRPRAGVVVFHSTVNHSIRQPAGVEGKPEKAFGLRLAERGFVALCPRNFLWPTNDKIDAANQARRFLASHPGVTGMEKMLADAKLAIDLLVENPAVDKNRIGVIGHSLGAKEVLYVAAFDDRVRAAISSEGGIGTKFSNWDAPWYLGSKLKDWQRSHEHHELLALIAPRPFLLIGGESADGKRSWPFIHQAQHIYKLHGPSSRLGFLNHGQGHAVPAEAEEKIYDWLTTYLQ